MYEGFARRKIKSILNAGAVGHSRLTRQDETATVATLKGYKEAVALFIERYRGRVVDSPGAAFWLNLAV